MKPAIRQKTNIIIDIAMFVIMIFLAIIGIVIRYALIPGSDRWIKYGQNVELTILGMDRHDWGLVHLIVGILLIGLLVLHLVFHWKQIVYMIKKLLPNRIYRLAMAASLLMLCTLILFSPLYLSPKIGAPIYGKGKRNERNNQWHFQDISRTSVSGDRLKSEEIVYQNKLPSKQEPLKNESRLRKIDDRNSEGLRIKEEHTLNIKGYHTFYELAKKYNISEEKLKRDLGIPESIPNNERLGRVRRIYDFTMSDVEEAILKLHED
jgi:hypothetical protein